MLEKDKNADHHDDLLDQVSEGVHLRPERYEHQQHRVKEKAQDKDHAPLEEWDFAFLAVTLRVADVF